LLPFRHGTRKELRPKTGAVFLRPAAIAPLQSMANGDAFEIGNHYQSILLGQFLGKNQRRT